MLSDPLCAFEFGIVVQAFESKPSLATDWYRFTVCAADQKIVRSAGSASMQIEHGLEALDRADIVVIPGWHDPRKVPPEAFTNSLVKAHNRGARIVAIGGGVFVLAVAGLLANSCAVEHWKSLHSFLDENVNRQVCSTSLFCDIDRVLTSAGCAAGIDLCLHVVRTDFGIAVAEQVSQHLIVHKKRNGSSGSANPVPQIHDEVERFQSLLQRLRMDLAKPYTLAEAAREMGVSERTLVRRFKSVTGKSFGEWMTLERLTRSKTLLRETELTVERIAEACGLASSGSLRRIFRENLQESPTEFRRATK